MSKTKTDTENLFETATRTKLRIPSTRGLLSVEQLWDVPLRSKDGFDLNVIAKGLNAELKQASEENFVDATKKTAKQLDNERAFDITKYIIDVKLDEENRAAKRAEAIKEREKLTEVLQKKQDEKLGELSEAAAQKRMKELNAVINDA